MSNEAQKNNDVHLWTDPQTGHSISVAEDGMIMINAKGTVLGSRLEILFEFMGEAYKAETVKTGEVPASGHKIPMPETKEPDKEKKVDDKTFKQMEKDYLYLSSRIKKHDFNEADGIAIAGIARALCSHYIITQIGGEL